MEEARGGERYAPVGFIILRIAPSSFYLLLSYSSASIVNIPGCILFVCLFRPRSEKLKNIILPRGGLRPRPTHPLPHLIRTGGPMGPPVQAVL